MSRRPLGAWLFGKLPAHGDFVARGLDLALRDGLDAWLARGLASARQRWGDDAFEARYFGAPPWMFVDRDPDGALSGGAVCVSLDSVGRKFPFLAAVPAANEADAMTAARACLETAYAAITEGWEADRVSEAIVPLENAANEVGDASPAWWLDAIEGPITRLAGRFPERLVEAMLEQAA